MECARGTSHSALIALCKDSLDIEIAAFEQAWLQHAAVRFNPKRHLVSKWGPGILRAHLSNFQHALRELGDFGSIGFLSSNMRLFVNLTSV